MDKIMKHMWTIILIAAAIIGGWYFFLRKMDAAALVSKTYLDIAKRPPTQEELTYWVPQVNAYRASGVSDAQIITTLENTHKQNLHLA